ncbi:MAG TPA: hypothetical protein VLZ12_10795 [Verrucomicrobiae bacterium]|nr:hypothetical protein [Verrucomicrobiae bacterium]
MAVLTTTTAVALGSAHAQTNSWTYPSGGYWDDFRNWSLGVRPASSQVVFITNAPAKLVTIDSYTSGVYPESMTVSDLTVLANGGATNTLFLSDAGTATPLQIHDSLMILSGGALLMANSSLLVGDTNSGPFVLEGPAAFSGTNFVSADIYVGYSTNSAGSVSLADGQTIFTNGYTVVGFYGSGRVLLSNGILQTEDDISVPNAVFVGFGPGSLGVLSISGGNLVVPEHLSLAEDTGSAGQLWLDGGQLIATNNCLITVGGNAAGRLIVSNGQLAASCLIVSDALGSSGTLTLAGGSVNLSGGMTIAQGQGATGSVFITGGQLLATNQGVLVNNFETNLLSVTVGGFGVGQLTVSNGSLLAQKVVVGDCENSQGTLTIAGGTVSVASRVIAGARSYIGTATNANARGAIQVTGGSLAVTNQSGAGLLTIGQLGSGLFIQSGGQVEVDQLTIAAASIWSGISTGLTGAVGHAVLSNGQLLAQSVAIGVGTNCQGDLTIVGGQLAVTNQSGTAQLVVGLAGLGTFAQSGGVVTVDRLLLTNGIGSVFSLSSGLFNTKSTTVGNGQTFFVGDGIDAATYHLLGGIHSFANGIEVRSNAVLSGCGTINGSVLVDPGGIVQADCGGALTFTGIVTNNGDLVAVNGSVLESYATVVNNGLINVLGGNTNFHSGFINNGVVLDSNSIPRIVSILAIGSDIGITFTTASNLTDIVEYKDDLVNPGWSPLTNVVGTGGITNVTDLGAAALTQRFYRVRLVVPQ